MFFNRILVVLLGHLNRNRTRRALEMTRNTRLTGGWSPKRIHGALIDEQSNAVPMSVSPLQYRQHGRECYGQDGLYTAWGRLLLENAYVGR